MDVEQMVEALEVAFEHEEFDEPDEEKKERSEAARKLAYRRWGKRG